MKKSRIYLLLILFTFLSSCEEEDNGISSSSDKIVGTWGNFKETMIGCNDSELPIETYDPYYEIITYNTDGTVNIEGNSIGDYNGTWKNLGEGQYQFSALGFTVNQKIEFICGNNIYKSIDDDYINYYEKIGYDNSSCDEVVFNDGLTYIPDDNFEKYLISRGWDDELDDYVLTENIQGVYKMDISNKHISDLTGIEDFQGLKELDVSYNKLEFLDISKNCNLLDFKVYNNPLICIEISQQQLINMPSGWEKSSTLIYALDCSNKTSAGKTYVPGYSFEKALIDLGYDDTIDTWVQTNNIDGITLLDISAKGISDLTGLEDFMSLTELKASNNSLNFRDFSENINLRYLDLQRCYLDSLDISNNSKLEFLNVNHNRLTSIDVSNNQNLEYLLACNFISAGSAPPLNHITSLDISNNSNLIKLIISNNELSALDVSNNPNLEYLDINNIAGVSSFKNKITELDFSNNPKLKNLYASNNNLELLDVSNTTLEIAILDHNNISSLDFSTSPNLKYLNAVSNGLESLNISNNSNLEHLDVHNYYDIMNGNKLESLDVSHINNLTFLSVSNSDFTCIQVSQEQLDDIPSQWRKSPWQQYSIKCNWYLDDNDRDGVEDNADNCPNTPGWETADSNGCSSSQIDSDGDGVMDIDDNCPNTANGETVDTNGCVINFNLTYVPDNNFEQALIDLGYDDVLDDYVLTRNINTISSLGLSDKGISDLTGIEDFNKLSTLDVTFNQLNSLDISNNSNLYMLLAFDNSLTSLNTTNNTALGRLFLNNNQLTSIDLSKNTNLVELSIQKNLLKELDVSMNTKLGVLVAYGMQLAKIDVSNITDLIILRVYENPLTCIQVNQTQLDNIPNNWYKDTDDIYSIDCNYSQIDSDGDGVNDSNDACPNSPSGETVDANGCSNPNAGKTYVPDDNFEQALIDLGYDDLLDDYVLTNKINTIITLEINDRGISDLTGIEDFTSLRNLWCTNNLLTGVNLSNSSNLEVLAIRYNQLTSLNLLNNLNLVTLVANNNQLTSLDISKNSMLDYLNIEANQLTSLNVFNNPVLTYINIINNRFTSLDVSKNSKLTILRIDLNQISSIDVSNNLELGVLHAGYNQLTSLDVTNNNLLYNFYANNNQLTSLDISNNNMLKFLYISFNKLTSLNLSNNTLLESIKLNNNELNIINVSNNLNITTFYINANPLTCIQVNQAQLDSIPSNWVKDTDDSYSINCN